MLQMRDSFSGMAGQVDMNSDAIVRHALKGVEATQFVYHSVGRSAFMRTATGKVLTRFKTFVQNQIAFQREVHRQAKMYGFKNVYNCLYCFKKNTTGILYYTFI